jgi:hypothetical protein
VPLTHSKDVIKLLQRLRPSRGLGCGPPATERFPGRDWVRPRAPDGWCRPRWAGAPPRRRQRDRHAAGRECPAHSDRVEQAADGQRAQRHTAERAREDEAGDEAGHLRAGELHAREADDVEHVPGGARRPPWRRGRRRSWSSPREPAAQGHTPSSSLRSPSLPSPRACRARPLPAPDEAAGRERREREAEQVGAVTVPASDRRRQLLNRRHEDRDSTAPGPGRARPDPIGRSPRRSDPRTRAACRGRRDRRATRHGPGYWLGMLPASTSRARRPSRRWVIVRPRSHLTARWRRPPPRGARPPCTRRGPSGRRRRSS